MVDKINMKLCGFCGCDEVGGFKDEFYYQFSCGFVLSECLVDLV